MTAFIFFICQKSVPKLSIASFPVLVNMIRNSFYNIQFTAKRYIFVKSSGFTSLKSYPFGFSQEYKILFSLKLLKSNMRSFLDLSKRSSEYTINIRLSVLVMSNSVSSGTNAGLKHRNDNDIN